MIDFLGCYYLKIMNESYEKQHGAYINSVVIWLLSQCHFSCFHLYPMQSFPTMWVLVLTGAQLLCRRHLHPCPLLFSTMFYDNSTMVVHTWKSMMDPVRTSSLLQVQLSIWSRLGLSLQAGPSVTRSQGSDVTNWRVSKIRFRLRELSSHEN